MPESQEPFGDAAPELPRAVWSGSFRLFGVEVRCHVLDTGERIVEADSFADLLDAMAEGPTLDASDIEAFARWQRGAGDA